jgi:hypothetical protein
LKKFNIKLIPFVLPFLVLFFVKIVLYTDKEGDLLRIGYIPKSFHYKKDGLKYAGKNNVENISTTKKTNFKILIIGDSFSEGQSSFSNHLTKNFSVLHIERFVSINQIQTLVDLINGDFFDYYKFDYVILENIERHVIDLSENIEFTSKVMKYQVDSFSNNLNEKKSQASEGFFAKSTIEFPLYTMPRFYLQDDYLSNDLVYKITTNSKHLFNNNVNHLLVYSDDISNTQKNNQKQNIKKLESVLNKITEMLSKRNVNLIFLPVPDKYDFYYEYIKNKSNYIKPLFFEHMKRLDKKFIYIDSKNILAQYKDVYKDIYFYDDTHWTNIASNIIANEISMKIKQQDILTMQTSDNN